MDTQEFKHPLKSGLILTSNCKKSSLHINEFTENHLSYNTTKTYDNELSSGIFFPMLCLLPHLLSIYQPSFSLGLIETQLNKAVEAKTKLKTSFNVDLEPWEENWIEIVKNIIIRNCKEVKSLYKKNGTSYPNDLLSFRLGLVYGLLGGDKKIMKELMDIHTKYEESNKNDLLYITTKSFALEELGFYKEAEELVQFGLKIEPKEVWLQHVFAHLCFDTNRIKESIEFLVPRKDNWDTKNSFLKTHINWHLGVCYLETDTPETVEKGHGILSDLIKANQNKIGDSEFGLAVIAYLIRLYLREKKFDFKEWLVPIVKYISTPDYYVKHWIVDVGAVWLLSHVNANKDSFKDICSVEDKMNILQHSNVKILETT